MTFAKVITDSSSWLNKRLTTFHLKYPRYIHSELLTHRVFSKNSASSRAIPIEKFIKKVQDQPVLPLWTENQKGMQGPVITDTEEITIANTTWLNARDNTITFAESLNNFGIHKQNVNRLLEPWMYMEIVLTGTEFDNWFELRNHKDAQPEIKVLAELMLAAMTGSTPKLLNPGEWHIPFRPDSVLSGEWDTAEDTMNSILKSSVASCARVSYDNFDGTRSFIKDIELYNKLIVSEPLHASPAEHQARVPTSEELIKSHLDVIWFNDTDGKTKQDVGKYVSNLNGFIQLRKLIECGEFK